MAQTRTAPALAERHTITGPGIDRVVDGPARMALAMAQQAASRLGPGRSLYVRNADGIAIYRVDQLADGTTVSFALVEPGPTGRRHR